jgi:cytochrome c553
MMRPLCKTLLSMCWLASAAFGDQRNFEYCTVCHGANGNGNPAIHAPRIAGLEPWYLRSQFDRFKVGWRGRHADDAPGNEMRPVAEALSLAEIDQAIAYVGTLTPKAPPLTVSGDIAHGKVLYAACATCHGAHGEGRASLHAPALAMRTDWYLVTQLRNYRAGLRGGANGDGNGRQMRAAAVSTLPDNDAIDDVVAYIDTLR